MGSFSTKSLIISKEALPEPIIIPDRIVVRLKEPLDKIVSTFFLDSRCFERWVSLTIPLKYITCLTAVFEMYFLKL